MSKEAVSRMSKLVKDSGCVKVDWLGDCPDCKFGDFHAVYTAQGSSKFLYDDDIVECCNCGKQGTIVCYDGHASCYWERTQETAERLGEREVKVISEKEKLVKLLEKCAWYLSYIQDTQEIRQEINSLLKEVK
ncbi:hypothetical protein NVP1084O_061 [Vibrio phage 1.084.O._10N.261.49.F5]|nr:hypothetical protein NVP1084O_061 [Vibrio phage 1.084.O._10N.261.49.F5]